MTQPPPTEQAELADFDASENEPLRRDVRLLGDLLGETMTRQHGSALFKLVEEVRIIAKQARLGETAPTRRLIDKLSALPATELLNLARTFTLFLNLANIAEQHHQIRQRRQLARAADDDRDAPANDAPANPAANPHGFVDAELQKLLDNKISPEELFRQASKLSINLVLTAHPTEVLRRSVSSKFLRIARLLAEQDRHDLSGLERAQIRQALHRAIAEVWETDEIRRRRPTPEDEAKTSLVTVEHSLWEVVPKVVRELDHALTRHTGKRLPLDAAPIRFGSWMGGDRDGNPNTTPQVTRRVCLLTKLKAARMFLRDIDELRRDLSMRRCGPDLRQAVGADAAEPYRALLEEVIRKLNATVKHYSRLYDENPESTRHDTYNQGSNQGYNQKRNRAHKNIYRQSEQLRAPLMLCYDSLVECGDQMIADGRLTDILRRLDAFGLTLLKLDIRQEAGRHAAAIDAITQYLGLGSYAEWDEARRQEFLISELNSKRPLIASTFPAPGETSDEVSEVLATFRMLASENPESFGAYIISMASRPSDVLAVALLQKECRVLQPLPVVPLFERLDALRRSVRLHGQVVRNRMVQGAHRRPPGSHDRLFRFRQGRRYPVRRVGLVSGAGRTGRDICQTPYRPDLVPRSRRHRGARRRPGPPGHPFAAARGSVNGSMRVTEQGEVVQAKYGLPGMAEETLQIYIGAVLEASLSPPPAPSTAWQDLISQLSRDAHDEFQEIVRKHPDFAEYFRLATPQQELGNLKIGSRPARRGKGSDIQSLRAIPWIFAWTQTRLMLPAWLGVGNALQQARERGDQDVLTEMQRNWPFFKATLDSIEMVFSKANPNLSAIYDDRLVTEQCKPLGNLLREKYRQTVALVLEVTGHRIPLENEPVVRRSVEVRNTYVIPLNILQVELLSRVRNDAPGEVHDALLIAINGIAAGMRNTG